jgi:ribose 5-phosphate isomerase A
MVVITDSSKQVQHLGRFALPVEINSFGSELTRRRIHQRMADAGMKPATSSWRMATGESLLHTDGGHLILDLACGVIPDPAGLSQLLDDLPGVVEHGLFIGLADRVIVGEEAGARVVERRQPALRQNH